MSLADAAARATPAPRILYGRRAGRRLNPGRQRLTEALLPQLGVHLPEAPQKLDPAGLFARAPAAVWLEIGFGGGEHLAAQAAAHRDIGFVGCEPYRSGVAKLIGEVAERGLDNVRIFGDDARALLDVLAPRSIGRCFILFPDPWPKRRHHRRRLIAPPTLEALARVMSEGAELRVATDDVGYLRWTLLLVRAHPRFRWLAEGPSDWLQRGADWPPSRYEHKAIQAGRRPYFLRFVRG